MGGSSAQSRNGEGEASFPALLASLQLMSIEVHERELRCNK